MPIMNSHNKHKPYSQLRGQSLSLANKKRKRRSYNLEVMPVSPLNSLLLLKLLCLILIKLCNKLRKIPIISLNIINKTIDSIRLRYNLHPPCDKINLIPKSSKKLLICHKRRLQLNPINSNNNKMMVSLSLKIWLSHQL